MAAPDNDHTAVSLASFRRVLGKSRHLAHLFRSTRAIVHFGPWRHPARAVIRTLRPPRVQPATTGNSLLPGLDPRRVASALGSEGVCVVGRLPASFVGDLRAATDGLPPGEYAHFHEVNAGVHRLVTDEAVLSVLRTHLGAEPELLECTVVVHGAEDDSRTPLNAQRRFHFDYAGWQSLNLFVYLTDVEPDSGAHEVVVGTHRNRRLRDAVRPWLPDEEVAARFGDRIRTISGPAGTTFFEDVEAFHRRRIMKRRRAMLNVLWASHRGVLSHGRLAPRYSDYLQGPAAPAPAGSAAQP